MIDMTLAQAKVSAMEEADQWYSRVFGSPPTSRPMDGLIEWRFGLSHGVQVFHDPRSAGHSAVVVSASDIESTIARLEASNIDHGGVRPGGGGRLIELRDPDGNQVVILDASAAHDRPSGEVVPVALCFRRTIPGPPRRLWDAYADIEQRTLWAAPDGEQVVYDSTGFATDGTETYRCGAAGSLDNHVSTRYARVDAPHSFVALNELRRGDASVAVDTTHWRLDAAGSDTTLLSIDVLVTSLAGAGVLDGYRSGHERTLDRLERFLA